MKPDYAKILFVSVPLTFIFWIICFIGLAHATHNKNMTVYAALFLTVVFFSLFVLFSVKYAKKVKAEIDQKTPQSDGIFVFIFIMVLVATLVILGVFFNVPVESSQKYVFIISTVLTVCAVIGRFIKKRHNKAARPDQ